MIRSIISGLFLAATVTLASAAAPLELVDNPPDRHVVVKGDTLWDISGKFLQKPWRWPEIWRLNKDQIKNPHLIYPGDIVWLDLSDGSPRLRLGKPVVGQGKPQPKVYETLIAQSIPSIPPNVIEPFLSQPLIIEAGEEKTAPRIVATEEDRVLIGGGDMAYVKGIEGSDVIQWHVFRPGKALTDPETKQVLGYEAHFLGNAKLTRPGDPATMTVTLAKEDIHYGDWLKPAPPPTILAYVPRAPEKEIRGQIMSIYGAINTGGPGSIVSINRGEADGLENGHVIALYRKRTAAYMDDDVKRLTTDIPDERYGLAFVFRTFDHVAYALIVEGSKSVVIGDGVQNP